MEPMYQNRSFFSHTGGNVMILTGLAILLLIAVAGAGIDLGRQQLLKNKLQQAADGASLAGAEMYTGANDAQKQANATTAALRYFNLNFPTEYMGVSRPTPQISVSANTVEVKAPNIQLPTKFIKNVGIDTLTTLADSVSSTQASTSGQNFDLIFVLDDTLSMNSKDVESTHTISRIQALVTASNVIVQNVLGTGGSDSRVGMVVFQSDVSQSVALTGDESTITSLLNALPNETACCTNSAAGLDYALGTTSKDFRTGVTHAVVFITDGENNSFGGGGGGKGGGLGLNDPGGVQSDKQSLVDCTAFKSMSPTTLVYAIGFGTDAAGSGTVHDFLSACASGAAGSNQNQYFFIAPDSSTLAQVFSTIITSVKNVRITQ